MAKTTGKAYTPRKKNDADNVKMMGLEMGMVPPQALDIEEVVLGALMLEPDVLPDVLDVLSSECFYKDAHRQIFTAINRLFLDRSPVDIFTLSNELKKMNVLDEIGGSQYLAELSSKIGAAAHIDYHVKILLQKYIQREIISISYKAQRDSFDDNIPVDDLLDTTMQNYFSLSERNMKRETQSIQSVINAAIDEIHSYQDREDGLSGAPSGFVGIDKVTLGWQASDLVILAARPAMGKTAFVLTMARNMAVDHKQPIAFFSLEMSSLQLVKRLLVAETGIESSKLRGGKKLQEYELHQLSDRIKDLTQAPLYIDDTPSLSIYEFRSKARRLVRNAGVKLIIVDYLQLMSGPPELRGNREQEVSNISRNLKAIAKELDIPIIALSQLSRNVESRGGSKRPQLSDLRESGAIEQDADIVIFIHRPDYYGVQEDPAMEGLAEIIIAKHRNGDTCDVKMRFRKSEAKFYDIDETGFGDNFSMEDQMISSGMNNEYESLSRDFPDL